jgi:hypothetical protein
VIAHMLMQMSAPTLEAIIHKRRGGCWRERNTGTGGCDGSERRSWG